MKKGLLYLAVVIFSVCTLGACKEEDDTYDAYANWPARNAEYFAQIAAEARDSIARAKGQYGELQLAHVQIDDQVAECGRGVDRFDLCIY